jgi:hypothetical protein
MKSSRTLRQRALKAALSLIALAAVGVASAAGTFAVRNGTVAGGGGISDAGQFRLIGTIGEGASSTTSNQQFRLTSGYPATIGNGAQGGGPIFADGFED